MTRGSADPAVIRRHLAALREALSHLNRYSGSTPDALHANTDLRWTVERGLQLAAQNALDIATHIGAASGSDPADYASAIDNLAKLSILSAEFASRLRRLAGFRNVLVHAYLDLNLAVVASALNEGLRDLGTYADLIEAHLSRDETDRAPPRS